MQKAIEKFNKALDKSTNITMKRLWEDGAFKHMDESDFQVYSSMIELIDASLELTTKQAYMIDEINKKLDKLLVGKSGA